MFICGIDYSLTSPAITILEVSSDSSSFDNASHISSHALSSSFNPKRNKSTDLIVDNPNIIIDSYPKYNSQIERLALLAEWTVDKIPHVSSKGAESLIVALEGYAYSRGSAGMVFNVGEGGGVLKHVLYKERNIIPVIVAPNEVKKIATGSGRATKEEMVAEYEKRVGIKLIDNPKYKKQATDIADSYFVAIAGALKSKQMEKK